jgi:hypothetical protein
VLRERNVKTASQLKQVSAAIAKVEDKSHPNALENPFKSSQTPLN